MALWFFVEVAEQGSFAAAARRLNTAPPAAITRGIAEAGIAAWGSAAQPHHAGRVSTTEARTAFPWPGPNACSPILRRSKRAGPRVAGTAPAPGELRVTTAPILFGRLHVLPIVTEFLGRLFPMCRSC